MKTLFMGCSTFWVMLSLCIPSFILAQDCPAANLFFTTQAEIDAFPILYPNCFEVQNNLVVEGDSITDLSPLAQITSVGNLLKISKCDYLLSLQGLDQIESVSSLHVDNNDQLSNLSGLGGILELQDTRIINNDQLVSLEGLNTIPENASVIINGNLDLTDLAPLQGVKELAALEIVTGINLVDLSELNDLEIVHGNLAILGNSNLENLYGLENLERVGTDFELGGSPIIDCVLSTLDGLQNLRYVGGSFTMEYTPLQDFSALSSLDTVGGELSLFNLAITSLQGLEHVKHIGDGFHIKENHSLLNLNGWPSQIQRLNRLNIRGNGSLESLEGIVGLEVIDDYLVLAYNSDLLDISSLSSLQIINNRITIDHNQQLVSLSPFENLDPDSLDILQIRGNPVLSYCTVAPFCQHITSGGTVSIDTNGPGCENAPTFHTACLSNLNTLRGKVYLDLNCNQLQDTLEMGASNRLLHHMDTQIPFAASAFNGDYMGTISSENTFEFGLKNLPLGYWSNPALHQVTPASYPMIFEGLSFGLCPDSSFANAAVQMDALNVARPGFTHQIQICVDNLGSELLSGTLVFDYSGIPLNDQLTIVDAAGGVGVGQTLEWDINQLLVFGDSCWQISVKVDPSTPMETRLPFLAFFTVNGLEDIELENNQYGLEQVVVGSFDPNDKTAFPEEMLFDDYVMGQEIEYLIRFQNTGTFSAEFVEVLDTISPDLDLSTFRMINASHDYQISFPEERVVSWYFPDIHLPDSTSNEPESHGFIRFSLQAQEMLNLGDQVTNRVGIYFDFNAPVITNSAITKIIEPNSLSAWSADRLDWSVFPNPTTGALTITWTEPTVGWVDLLHSNGQLVERREIPDTGTLEWGLRYPKGVYLLRWQGSNFSTFQKVVLY